ncbi:hypothetical protein CPB84DRAFT_1792282 [Gymnopilus junonius]|uniref:Uncharacterized protein n=1 Tax=Gymnopilus junonius TaxID=109634 RepID=A0A9P5TI82_GYMJU|nr:hypothetical protein CPB84DRAFT_1792282 [Gymnopilus junonius]
MQCRTVESGDMNNDELIRLKRALNGDDAVNLTSAWVIGRANVVEGTESQDQVVKVSDVEVKLRHDRTK